MAKDKRPTVWKAEDGERLGTYVGHDGAVMQCCPSVQSTVLATSSADQSVRLWGVTDGQEYFRWDFDAPCRAVAASLGERLLVTTQDRFVDRKPSISLHRVDFEGLASAHRAARGEREDAAEDGVGAPGTPDASDGASPSGGGDGEGAAAAAPAPARDPGGHGTERALLRRIEMPFVGRVTRAVFSPLNDTVLSTHEDGHVRRWDAETGKLVADRHVHDKIINDLRWSDDRTCFVTASTDRHAKLVDTESLEVLKTYFADRPCNSADLSPLHPHVLVGGGQDAASVTTTSSRAGRFESAFFHRVYEEEFGMVRGHFGPINSVAFSPDGRRFATGGEDGYVRLATFDSSYHNTKFV